MKLKLEIKIKDKTYKKGELPWNQTENAGEPDKVFSDKDKDIKKMIVSNQVIFDAEIGKYFEKIDKEGKMNEAGRGAVGRRQLGQNMDNLVVDNSNTVKVINTLDSQCHANSYINLIQHNEKKELA